MNKEKKERREEERRKKIHGCANSDSRGVLPARRSGPRTRNWPAARARTPMPGARIASACMWATHVSLSRANAPSVGTLGRCSSA